MPDKKSVTVTIYKNEYTLKGDADPQQIIDLARYVDNRMTELGQKSSAPADKIAILVAMNIADELRRLEKVNEDNLEIIENLEKNFAEIKNNSNNTIMNAAAQSEENVRIQTELERVKKEYQILETEKTKLDAFNSSLKEKVDTLLRNSTPDLQNAFETQKKLTEEAQAETKRLKIHCNSLETQCAEVRESLQKALEPTSTPASHHNVTISNENLSRLITKINAVID